MLWGNNFFIIFIYRVKAHYNGCFEIIVVGFYGWIKYCYIVFKSIWENLAKVKWKIETYVLIFETLKKNYQHDKCSIQGGLCKAWYIKCHSPNYPQKFIIMNFFLLMELETKPTTLHHHTLKYHNTSNEKQSSKIFFFKIFKN
jgi:hypothetical protein